MIRRLSLTLLCSLVWASAQDTVMTTERLAALLLGEGDAVTFSVGQLPDGLDLPLPEGTRVLGGATIGDARSVTALEVQEWQVSSATFEDAFTAAGWRGYDPFASPDVFQYPDRGETRRPLSDFCHPDGQLEARVEGGADIDGATLMLIETRPHCNEGEEENLPVPRLTFPEGVNYGGGGSSWGSASFDVTAEYSGELSAQALFGHFAEQLQAQGWQVGEAAQTTSARSADLTLDTGGERWRGLLTVTGVQTILQVSRAP